MTAPYAPVWLAPSASGQLSNHHGSNQGADMLALAAQYSSPKNSGNTPSIAHVRFQLWRTKVAGVPIQAQVAADTNWMGGSPAAQQLTASKQACGGMSTVTYQGRIYFMSGDGLVQSAPANGPGVGTWRYETPLPNAQAYGPQFLRGILVRYGSGGGGITYSPGAATVPAYSMTLVGGRLYALAAAISSTSTQASMFMSTIQPDGSLSQWQTVPGGIIGQSDATFKNAAILGGWDGSSATGWIVLVNGANHVFTYTVNISDGSITTAPNDSGGTTTVARDNWAGLMAFNNGGTFRILVMGGTATVASSVVDGATIDPTTGFITGGFAAKQALPAAVSAGVMIRLQSDVVYYIAGSTTGANGGVTTTIYRNTGNGIYSAFPWTTDAQVIGTALWKLGGGVVNSDFDVFTPSTGLLPGICVIGGVNNLGAFQTNVQTALAGNTSNGALLSFTSGQASVLTQAALGTGGQLAALNADGSQNLAYAYGAQGTLNGSSVGNFGGYGVGFASGFSDGDELLLAVTTIGLDGDPSTTTVTTMKIGQAPSISGWFGGGISTGLPNIVFQYFPNPNQGVGPQAWWRFSITDPTGKVVFDTGQVNDTTNNVQTNLAPVLQSGVAYTFKWQVASQDVPVPNGTAIPNLPTLPTSFNSATITQTVTPSYTPPPAPIGLTATTDPVLCAAVISWANVNSNTVPAAFNRLYYRRTGTQQWYLLRDQIPATRGGPQQAITQMDQLALGVSYDFAVTALDSTGALESPLTVWSSSLGESMVNPALPTPTIIVQNDFETAPDTTDYYHSLGSEALGTLAQWTTVAGTPTIAANVASLNSAVMYPTAGHPDWGDQLFRVRFNFAAGGIGFVWLHQTNLGAGVQNGIAVRFTTNSVILQKYVAGTATNIGTLLTPVLTAGTWYWAQLVATGTTYSVTIYNDAAGVLGTALAGGSTSGTIADASLQNGNIGLQGAGTAVVQYGGAFNATCLVTGPAPSGWQTTANGWATALEPAFCWSKKKSYSGGASLSVSVNAGTPQSPVWFNTGGVALTTADIVTVAAISVGGATASMASSPGAWTRQDTTSTTWVLLSTPVTSAITSAYNLRGSGAAGIVYFDNAATYVPGVPTNVLSRSLGSDATGNLSFWTLPGSGTWSIAGNIATGVTGSPARIQKGHPELTDYQVLVRTQWTNIGGAIRVLLRAQSGTGSPAGYVVGQSGTNTLGAWRLDNNIYTGITGGGVTLTTTPNEGQWVWLLAAVAGGVVTATFYADLNGAMGAALGPTLTANTDTTYTSGPVQLLAYQASGQYTNWGGPYPNVFIIQAALPSSAWGTQAESWTVSEPDFCLSTLNPHTGASASVYGVPLVTSNGDFYTKGASENVALAVLPNTSYTITFWMKTTGVSGTGAYLRPIEWTSGGAVAKNWGTTAMTPVVGTTGWTCYTVTITTTGTTAFLSLRTMLTGAGLVYFDDFVVQIGGTVDVANTIPLPISGATAMLHLAGSSSIAAGLMLSGGPEAGESFDSNPVAMFNLQAPALRTGVLDYRKVRLRGELVSMPTDNNAALAFANLQAVLAQMRAGGQVYLRTAGGVMMTVGLAPEDQNISFLPASYLAKREVVLSLVQTNNNFLPNVDAPGSALGILPQVAGMVQPLDPSEFAI